MEYPTYYKVHRPRVGDTGTVVLFAENKVDFSLFQRNQTETFSLHPPTQGIPQYLLLLVK